MDHFATFHSGIDTLAPGHRSSLPGFFFPTCKTGTPDGERLSHFPAALMRYLGAELPVREQPMQETKQQPAQEKITVTRLLGRGTQVKLQVGTHQPGTDVNKPGEDKPLDQPEFEMLFDAKQQASPYAFERFNCRMPSSQEAELLHMGRNQPVIDIERWTWFSTHKLFEYEHIVANALLHEYTYIYEDRGKYEELRCRQDAGS